VQAFQHAVQVLQHIPRRDAPYLDPSPRQPVRPAFVVAQLVGVIMALSIHLDRQPRRLAIEVQYIGSDRMLTPEARAAEPACPQLAHNRTSGRVSRRRSSRARSIVDFGAYMAPA